MPAPHIRTFRDGKTLEGELAAAMHRVGALGVTYPEHYYETLVAKYKKDSVPYPHILTILGEPRIKGHFFYSEVLRRTGPFLDYGCGTGDNIRQLLRDGFSRAEITGFDLSWESIDLGFDLYRDRDALADLFVVNDTFPFGAEQFDMCYSGSVIHIIADDTELDEYPGKRVDGAPARRHPLRLNPRDQGWRCMRPGRARAAPGGATLRPYPAHHRRRVCSTGYRRAAPRIPSPRRQKVRL